MFKWLHLTYLEKIIRLTHFDKVNDDIDKNQALTTNPCTSVSGQIKLFCFYSLLSLMDISFFKFKKKKLWI